MTRSSTRDAAPAVSTTLVLGLLAIGLAGCSSVSAPKAAKGANASKASGTPALPASIPAGMSPGYLGNDLPNSLTLLPPPPSEGSAAFANDEAEHDAAQALKGTPRYTLATSDANLTLPHAVTAFECALDMPITQQDTPRLYQLMQRVMVDAGLGTYAAKNHYNRIRPFVHYNEHTCLAADEAALRHDGSYPSGHTAIGWVWGLLLTDLAPDRDNELLARGRAFGESRMVCNAHWQSDVLEGRAVGAGVFAQLQSNADFRRDMEAAGKEIARQRSAGKRPSVDCATEAQALAIKIKGVL